MAGVQSIQDALQNHSKNFNLLVSNDSKDLDLNLKTNWIKGPQNGPAANWNFLIKHVRCSRFMLVHQDEVICPTPGYQKTQFDKNIIYVTDLQLIKNNKTIYLSGKLRAFLMNYFPRLIFNINFIGPTACLLIPNNNLRFNEKLNWLVDVDYYWRLREIYRFEYTPHILTISNTDTEQSITNSGKLGKIDDLLKKELVILKKNNNRIWRYICQITWHIYRIINTRYS